MIDKVKVYPAFDSEVKLQVGQRVEIDLPEVPVEERDVTTGIIVGISVRFPTTPKLRYISYEVRFDRKGNYIKKEYRLVGGLGFLQAFGEEHLRLLEVEETKP